MIRVFYGLATVVMALLAFALYVAKTEAQSAQQRIASMEDGIISELAHIAQLENELAYLERPERLEALARVHLQLRPLAPEQDMAFALLSGQYAGASPNVTSKNAEASGVVLSGRAHQ